MSTNRSLRGAVNPRVLAAVVLVVVLLVGGIAGAAVERTMHRGRRGPRDGMPSEQQRSEMRKRGLERMSKELSLDESQRSQVERAMAHHDSAMQVLIGETRPRFMAIADSLDRSIESVLRPEQREKFRAARDRRRGPFPR